MSKKNNGGSAFPITPTKDGETIIPPEKMSLRDYFAAKAMQAIISKMPLVTNNSFAERNIQDDMSAAYGAYFYADAMLKAREE